MATYYVNIIYHSNIPENDSTATILKSFSNSSESTTAKGYVTVNGYNKSSGPNAPAASTSFPDYSGHTFVGWNTEADGSGSQYAPGSSFYVEGIMSYTYPRTRSLYAVWKPIINKVVYGGETLIDLTEDTVGPSTLLSGFTAHAATGEEIVGTFDSYTKTEIDNLLNAKADSADIPTNVSDLNNDAGYIENGTTDSISFNGNVAIAENGLIKIVPLQILQDTSIAAGGYNYDTYTMTTTQIGAGWLPIGISGYVINNRYISVYNMQIKSDNPMQITRGLYNSSSSARSTTLTVNVLCIRTSV